jgi:hypothetical protein
LRYFFSGIQLNEVMQILGKVDYHSDITTLSRQAGATYPPGDRRPMEATNSYGINNILLVSWNYDSNRNLSIVGAVRCIEQLCCRHRSGPRREQLLAALWQEALIFLRSSP